MQFDNRISRDESIKWLRKGVRGNVFWNMKRQECLLGSKDPFRDWLTEWGAVDLRGVDLRNADLSEANLTCVDFTDADLSFANLLNTDLRGAIFDGAVMDQTGFVGAVMDSTELNGTRFYGATMGCTILGNLDLSSCFGLDRICHAMPSTVGIDTIVRSKGKIPEEFLRGCEVPETIIDIQKLLY